MSLRLLQLGALCPAHLRNAHKRAHTGTSHFCICRFGAYYGTCSCGRVLGGAVVPNPLPHALDILGRNCNKVDTALGLLRIHAALDLKSGPHSTIPPTAYRPPGPPLQLLQWMEAVSLALAPLAASKGRQTSAPRH